jgi:hypothetical protein
MFGAIYKYKSSLEKSYILVERKRKNILFWVFSEEKRDKEVLSFDNLNEDEDTAKQLFAWFKHQESKGIPLSKALEHLEGEAQALETMVMGRPRNRKSKS